MKDVLCSLLSGLVFLQAPALAEAVAGDPSPEALPSVMWSPQDLHAGEEGAHEAVVLVKRTGDTSEPLTVHYAVAGTAGNGEDYQYLPGQVTLPAGEASAPVAVLPIDDELPEATETVILELLPSPDGTQAFHVEFARVVTLFLHDNDGGSNHPPAVAWKSPSDGDKLPKQDAIRLRAVATDPDNNVAAVEFFVDGELVGRTPGPHPPAIEPSDAEILAAAISSAGDFAPSDSRAYSAVWSHPQAGGHELSVVAVDTRGLRSEPARIHVTVLAPQPRNVVNLWSPDPEAREGTNADGQSDPGVFRVHRIGDLSFPLSVSLRFGGTADPELDYEPVSSTVIIPAGHSFTDITVVPFADALAEGPETVIARLEPPACMTEASPAPDCWVPGDHFRATMTIRDPADPNENLPPHVQMVLPADGEILKAGATAYLVAHARDFDGRVVSVEFFDGEESLGVFEPPPDDPSADGVPLALLTWENVPAGRHILTAAATDNEGARSHSKPHEIQAVSHEPPTVVTVEVVDGEATEGGMSTVTEGSNTAGSGEAPLILDTARFRIRRDGTGGHALKVRYRLHGTATPGQDYESLPGAVEIPAGENSAAIDIIPIDDNLLEGDESVVITILPPSSSTSAGDAVDQLNYVPGRPSAGIAVIHDDEQDSINHPPRVTMLRPLDGMTFHGSGPILLEAAAHDPDGEIESVEFFSGHHSLGFGARRAISPPPESDLAGATETSFIELPSVFGLEWKEVPAGEHAITALATDTQEESRRSEPVNIRVENAPSRAVVQVRAVDDEALEAPPEADVESTATFVLHRKGGVLDEALPVFYRLEGSAQNGIDYEMLSGEAFFEPGQTETRVVIRPIDDHLSEPTEQVVLRVLPPACIAIFPPPPGCYLVDEHDRATVRILDNDFQDNHPPRATILSPRDGDQFHAPATIDITVDGVDKDGWISGVEFYLDEVLVGDSVVHFLVSPPPGRHQRFVLSGLPLEPGEHTLQVVAIDNLSARSQSAPVRIQVRDASQTPIVRIYTAGHFALEGTSDATIPHQGAFRIERTGSLDSPLLVHLHIAGTAANGVDYRTLEDSATIPAGESQTTLVVDPIDDALVEGSETVVVAIVAPPQPLTPQEEGGGGGSTLSGAYEIGHPHRSALVIVDNDHPQDHPIENADATRPHARRFDDGVVHMTLPAGGRETVMVEASANLVDWFPVGTGTVENGVVQIIDGDSLGQERWFYRAVPEESQPATREALPRN